MKNKLFYLLFVFHGAFINGQNVSNIQINTSQTHIAFLANRDTLKIKMLSSSEKPLVIATGLASTKTNSGLEDERFLLWDNEGTRFIYQKNQRLHVYFIENQTTKSFVLPEKLRLFKFFRINQIDIFQDILYFSAGYASEATNFNLFSFNLDTGKFIEILDIPEQVANVTVSANGQTLAFSFYSSTYEYITSGLRIIDLKTKDIISKQDFKIKSFLSNLSFLNPNKLMFRNVYGDNYILDFSTHLPKASLNSFPVQEYGYFLRSYDENHILQLNFKGDEKRYSIFKPEGTVSSLLLQQKNIQLLESISTKSTLNIYYTYQDGKTPKRLLKAVRKADSFVETEEQVYDFDTENKLKNIDYQIFEYDNSAGNLSKAFLYLPDRKHNAKATPLIIVPYGRYGDFYPDFSYFLNKISFKLVNEGFAIAFVNTTAYADFNLKKEYGFRQLKDIRLFIDAISNKYSLDTDKIYALGHSHGATMVYYYLTHSDLFSGGIAINGATDWIEQAKLKSMTGLPGEMGGSPEELKEKYLDYSPLENLSENTNRVLIVSGGKDQQIPYAINAKTFHERALELGLNFEWLHFEDEGHLIEQQNNLDLIFKSILELFENNNN